MARRAVVRGRALSLRRIEDRLRDLLRLDLRIRQLRLDLEIAPRMLRERRIDRRRLDENMF